MNVYGTTGITSGAAGGIYLGFAIGPRCTSEIVSNVTVSGAPATNVYVQPDSGVTSIMDRTLITC